MNKAQVKRALKKLFYFRLASNVTVNIAVLPQNQLLKSRSAIVTGGTSGIGYAIAEAFLQAGASVIITGRSRNRLDATVEKLKKATGKALVFGFELDNTKVDSFEGIFQSMLSQVQAKGIATIDILVNNAGVNFKGMPNVVVHVLCVDLSLIHI
eukprot:TRINITY_DN35998_c0_g1_i1.p1 TRINITY_DN35998_c0_g1~~TRINITY_DN35998_c0_g1_i1.p1  ORF type:complete len:154 (+),score=10.62 TRINITY_DN35998_c0_g1_i1:230-691(+)